MRGKGREPARPAAGARAPGRFDCADADYHRWSTRVETVDDAALEVAWKPGLLSAGRLDPAAELLARHLEVSSSDRVCNLYCGEGLVGALAVRRAPSGRVWMADRHLPAVEAARRTLAANGISGVEVSHGIDAPGLGDGAADVVAARLPEGRLPMLLLLGAAYRKLRPGGLFYLAGGNHEGIKTAFRHAEALFGGISILGYRAGHRVAVAVRPEEPAEPSEALALPWLDPERFLEFPVSVRGGEYRVLSRPGVFSWDRLDRGSKALIGALEPAPGDRVLELGCGYGIVGTAAARLEPTALVTMVDVDAEALRSARRTAEANGFGERCEVLAGDAAASVAERSFDLVVTNPPFHVGKATDLEVPAQFVRDAARVLRPGGRLLLVANRTLPYESWLEACFGGYSTLVDGREFKVLAATRR